MQDSRGAQAFVAVAEHRSFSTAARALGVTASTLSQAVRALEERVGVPLLVRTTRSVSLTEAGRRLLARLAPALRETESALEEARGSAGIARGTLRLCVARSSVPLIIEPVLGPLLDAHPALSVEVSIEDRLLDIVAHGFDAGIRVSESIEQDFTAVRLTPPFRLLAAGAPSYLAQRGRPKRPEDLLAHDCLNHRKQATGAFSGWKFQRGGKLIEVAVTGRLACNDLTMMLNAARAGRGLVYFHEPGLRACIERGELEPLLEKYAVIAPGFFLYFPKQSGDQAKVRAFIEVAKMVLAKERGPAPRGGALRDAPARAHRLAPT